MAWRAALAAGAGSVMVGFLPIVTRRLYEEGMSTPSLLLWRYAIALAAIAIAARLVRLDIYRAGRRGAWRIALIGATLGAGQTVCFFESLRYLETGIAVLLFYTYPAVTLVLDRVFFGRRVRPIAVLCVAMILTGAGLIAAPGLRGGTIDPHGFLWAVPGPLIYALYLTANARLMARHPPLVSAGYLYLGFATTYLAAALFTGLDLPQSAGGWGALLFIALGAGALTATLFSYSVPRLGPSSYAIIANCELITVVAIGVLALGEVMDWMRAAGALLIASSILLHGFFGRVQQAARPRALTPPTRLPTSAVARRPDGRPLPAGGGRKVRAPRRYGAG